MRHTNWLIQCRLSQHLHKFSKRIVQMPDTKSALYSRISLQVVPTEGHEIFAGNQPRSEQSDVNDSLHTIIPNIRALFVVYLCSISIILDLMFNLEFN